MHIRKQFAAVSLAVLTVAGGALLYSSLPSDKGTPLADHLSMQPSKTTLTQVEFLDKHFSLNSLPESFQTRFRELAIDIGKPEVSKNIDYRLLVVTNLSAGQHNGRVSSIKDLQLQQRTSDALHSVIGEGFEELRKGDEAKFDKTIKLKKHADINVTYIDFKNSENLWRRTVEMAPIAPTVDRSDVSANVVLVQNLPPQNGQIYVPNDAGRPQFKGFTSESRRPLKRNESQRLQGAEDQWQREQRQIQSAYGANNYGFGRQPEDIETRMRDLPGVFTGAALTSMAIIGREMANLSSDPKLKADLFKRVNDLERDAAGVGKDEMKTHRTRTLSMVDTNNPEVQKILMRGYLLAQWMVAPAQKQLFEKALLSGAAKNPAHTKAGIQGAANIDYINGSSYRVLRQKNLLPEPAPRTGPKP